FRPCACVIDLPSNVCIEELTQLLKGSSSHWINQGDLLPKKFAWGRGYGVFSVSQSALEQVAHYIATQEEHQRKKSFSEELESLVNRHALKWDPETVKTVRSSLQPAAPR